MRPAAALLLALTLLACGGRGDDEPDAPPAADPRVDLILPAIDAIGADEYLEIVATSGAVTAIVRAPDSTTEAVGYVYDGVLRGPDQSRTDARQGFSGDDVELDPDVIFDQLHEELPTARIVDLAIHVDSTGLVIDATVASASGGQMLVLLSGDGEILATQAL